MTGDGDRLALHRIEQLSEAVLCCRRGHGDHGFTSLEKLADIDNIANIAISQGGDAEARIGDLSGQDE
jgi:hypothetical protein